LLDGFGLSPTLIVSTGGGLHVYWLFYDVWYFEGDADRNKAKDLSRRFQQAFINYGKQLGYVLDNTSELNRLLRIPGTYNYKNEPQLVEIFQIDGGCRYDPGDIDSFLMKLDVADLEESLTESAEISEGKRNTTLASIAGKMRAEGAEHDEILQQLTKINTERCNPALPDGEVRQIAQSVSGYEPNSKQPTQAQQIVALAERMEFFHTSDGEAYAQFQVDSHQEIWPLRSKAVRHYLDRLYRKENNGAVPGSQGRQDALGVLEGIALLDSPKKQVHVRVAELDGAIYLDLCNETWEVVKIDQSGWQIVANPPVAFVRAKGMGKLPVPERGGSIESLFEFVNADQASQCLLVSFLVASLRPGKPFPILILQGEQGSAKSTTAKIARELIDPSASPLRTLPGGDRDLMVSANNSWILAYDNLSGVTVKMSDALCRISTGGGFSTRSLYTDGDEKIFDSMRPVVLNGIDDIANRGDLADRAIILNLPRISKKKRKLESELWFEFNQAKPGILGALLDAVSIALKNLGHVKLESLPRMADFAQWVVAAEPALPWEAGYFMKVHSRNQAEASQNVLESDPVARALMGFVSSCEGGWKGTATELLKRLDKYTEDDRYRYGKSWPKSPAYLSNRVRRIAPQLREAGLAIVNGAVKGKRIWKFSLDPSFGGVGTPK
jgi:hypothetical protein